MIKPRPRRSVLYMPGANARALEKAKTIAADALILDLEDAVAPDAKSEARDRVAAAVAGGDYGMRELVVRINALDTPWGTDDLAALSSAPPHAVLLPKPDGADDIMQACAAMEAAGLGRDVALWAMVETPRAILNLASIAETARRDGGRLACLVMGTNDLVKETRAELDRQRTSALFWLSTAVTAARAYGLTILDGVYNNFRDAEGFEYECRHGKSLGMDGKTLIHPDQVAMANTVFAPTADEVAAAREIIAAFAEPENQGKGVIKFNGKMVELLHAEIARDTVAIADAIAALDQ